MTLDMTFRFEGETYKGYAAAHPLSPIGPENPILLSGCCTEEKKCGDNILLDGGLENHVVGDYIKVELTTDAFPNASSGLNGLDIIEPPNHAFDSGYTLRDAGLVTYASRLGQTFTTQGLEDSAFMVGTTEFPLRKWMPYVSDVNPQAGSKHLRLTHNPAVGSLNSLRPVLLQSGWFCRVPYYFGGNQHGATTFVSPGETITASCFAMANRLYSASGSTYPKIQISFSFYDEDTVPIVTGLSMPTGTAVTQTVMTTTYQQYMASMVAPARAYACTVAVLYQHGNVLTGGLVHVDSDSYVLNLPCGSVG